MDVDITLVFTQKDSQENHRLGVSLTKELKDSVIYSYKLQARKSFESETQSLKSAQNTQEFEEELSKMDNNNEGSLRIYDLQGRFRKDSKIIIGRHRSIFINDGEKVEISDLVHVIREIIYGESVVERMLNTINYPRVNDNLNLRRVSASGSGYNIQFSLLIPEPEQNLNSWRIESAIESYVDPLISSLGNFSEFTIKSQILYLSKLNLNPKLDSKTGQYKVDKKDLGLAINSVESQLASHVSSNPSLNFLVYIPPKAASPLIIDDSENAFMLPKWGGVVIYNKQNDGDEIDMSQVMNTFMTQLRLLLGLQEEIKNRSEIEYLPLNSGELRTWEKEFLLRLRGMENLSLSRVTLQSLAHLLSQISNIVIVDEIGREVENAVSYFNKGSANLKSGLLSTGFLESQKSFRSSEIAFFDPSLLALLYFPEDQKYAIYIPLFLPVGIPVIMSFVSLFKHWKKKNQTI